MDRNALEDTTAVHFDLGRQAAYVTHQLNANEVAHTGNGTRVTQEEFAKLRSKVLADPVEVVSIRGVDIVVRPQLLLTATGF